jgi:hypothetical protein
MTKEDKGKGYRWYFTRVKDESLRHQIRVQALTNLVIISISVAFFGFFYLILRTDSLASLGLLLGAGVAYLLHNKIEHIISAHWTLHHNTK